jgi:chaperonin GroES|tara:strand:+ start:9251 stop:9532 length:282 start_codon:yes stop_codon:yes gene_type:complete
MQPLHDKILVKRKESMTKSSGGIILTKVAKDKPAEGEVIAIGPGKVNKKDILIPLEVQVGDMIIFGPHNGDKIEIDGEEFIILSESDVFGVIE